jgi:hypothetical protein
MSRVRRLALAMCAAAVGVFVTSIAVTSEPVSALGCYQYCDALLAGGYNRCNIDYESGSPEWADCNMYYENLYWECMYHSTYCGGACQCWYTGAYIDGIPQVACSSCT